MSNCGSINFENGETCDFGIITGMIKLPNKWVGQKSELAKITTLQGLIAAGASVALFADSGEPVASAPNTVSWDNRADTVENVKKGGYTLKFIKNAYNQEFLKSIGNGANIFWLTSKNVILGINTPVALEISSFYGTFSTVQGVNGKTPTIDVTFSYKDDFEGLTTAAKIEDGYTASDIPNWEAMNLAFSAKTATSLSFNVYDLADNPSVDFDENNFVLTDLTGNLVVAHTAVKTENLVVMKFTTQIGLNLRVTSYASAGFQDLYTINKTFTEVGI